MKPRTHKRLLKAWPALCGLVIGGLLGGLTGSLAFFALFGGIAWGVFHVLAASELFGPWAPTNATVAHPPGWADALHDEEDEWCHSRNLDKSSLDELHDDLANNPMYSWRTGNIWNNHLDDN